MLTLLRMLYVCCMGLKKRVSMILIMPGIVFLLLEVECELDMLPPTHYALELHIKIPNYQAKICKG